MTVRIFLARGSTATAADFQSKRPEIGRYTRPEIAAGCIEIAGIGLENGSSAHWWLSSSNNTNNAGYVNTSGTINNNNANNDNIGVRPASLRLPKGGKNAGKLQIQDLRSGDSIKAVHATEQRNPIPFQPL